MNKSAFTLIEFLVYMALLGLLTMMTFGFCCLVRDTLSVSEKSARKDLHNALVVDTIRRDLISSSMHTHVWDAPHGVFVVESMSTDGVIKHVAIGWEVVQSRTGQNRLRRSQGMYDFERSLWKQRSVSLIPTTFDEIRVTPVVSSDRQRIERVVLMCSDKNQQLRQVVTLRNRVFCEI